MSETGIQSTVLHTVITVGDNGADAQPSTSTDAENQETSQATPAATASTATANTATVTATTAQAGAAADEDSDDKPEEAQTQDQPDDEELPPGDDQPEEGRVAAGGEGNNPPPDDRVEKIRCCFRFPVSCTCVISVLYIIVSLISLGIHLADWITFLIYTKFQTKYLLDILSFFALDFQVFAINAFLVGTLIWNFCCCCNPKCCSCNQNAAGAAPGAAGAVAECKPRCHGCHSKCCSCDPECCKSPKLFETGTVRSSIRFIKQSAGKSKCVLVTVLVLLVILCLINFLAQIGIGLVLFNRAKCHNKWQMALIVMKPALSFFCYCPFWCVVYIQRSYMEKRLKEAPCEIQNLAPPAEPHGENEQAHEARDRQAFEAIRHATWQLIEGIHSEYESLKTFTGRWMVCTLFTMTFHAICCWILFQCRIIMSDQPLHKDKILQVELWCENIVFFIVPVIALRGFNIDYLWKDFHRRLSRSASQAEGQFKFWNDVLNMIIQMNAVSFPISFMQVVSFFSGTVLAEIFSRSDSLSFEYWIYASNCAVEINNNTCHLS